MTEDDPSSRAFGVAGEFGDLSTKGAAVLSIISLRRNSAMSQSAMAPEMMRVKVKLAASMLVCFSANRQSTEFPANAAIAVRVRMKIRVGVTDPMSER